jgi:uncharacterized protein UPF0158
MNTLYEIRNWLELAFAEPADRINESYYFDRRNSEFFSVFITDYFLTDPNSEDEYPNSPYFKEELAILSERIDRLEDKASFIVSIPRLTIQERKELMLLFIDKYDSLNKDELQTIIAAENGRTNLDFNAILLPEVNEDWRKFKYNYIQTRIDSFCNLNNIDLETSSLWTDQKMNSMTLNLKDTPEAENKGSKKTWWKFW